MEVVDALLARQDLHRLRLQEVPLKGLSAGGAAHVAVVPAQHQEGAIGKAQHKLLVGPCGREGLRREALGTEPGGAPGGPIKPLSTAQPPALHEGINTPPTPDQVNKTNRFMHSKVGGV